MFISSVFPKIFFSHAIVFKITTLGPSTRVILTRVMRLHVNKLRSQTNPGCFHPAVVDGSDPRI